MRQLRYRGHKRREAARALLRVDNVGLTRGRGVGSAVGFKIVLADGTELQWRFGEGAVTD